MTARRQVLALACAALLAAAAGAARAADQVVLREGDVISGVLEDETEDHVVIRVGSERRVYPRRLVLRVTRDRLAAPPTAADTAPAAPAPSTPASPTPAPAASAAAKKPEAPRAQPSPSAEPAAAREAAPVVDPKLVAAVEDGPSAQRAEALESIAAGWPATRPTFERLLRHPSSNVRLCAGSVLDDARIEGAPAYVAEILSDESPAVRRIAVRLVRKLALAAFGERVANKVASDADKSVRMEALRTLEDVGTAPCLRPVLQAWELEREANLKGRYLRVLRKLTGEDAKDDVDGWRAAVDRAVLRASEERFRAPAPSAAPPSAAPPRAE